MHSITLWKVAPSPNYTTNINLMYPYSETPFLGQYNLVKIPRSLNALVPHVDYWGEGKITSTCGTSGFANCYNVNHSYRLVSHGADKNNKIPNRIPVFSYDCCDTSAYIADNSVALVTVMGACINSSCAADIARIVNNDLGKVIVYGLDSCSQDIHNLITALQQKSLTYCSDYKLPNKLKDVSLFNCHMAFLNVNLTKDLYQFVINGEYDNAVDLTKKLANDIDGEVISELILKLINGIPTARATLMSFGYKLWIGKAKDVVQKYFPNPLKLVIGQEIVKIVNKGYNQALKLDKTMDTNDRLTWGDSSDDTSRKVSWQFIPVWANNEVTFKMHNIEYDMYLKLDVNTVSNNDRKVWGSSNTDEDRYRYYVEPYMEGDVVKFHIINYGYRLGLKLDATPNCHGDRALWGHNGDIYKDETRFKWLISEWQ